MILLDTCVLLWLGGSAGVLSDKAIAALREQADHLYVSAMSAWEIGIKHAQGKLDLGEYGPVEWFERACRQHGLREIPVDSTIGGRAPLLEPHHNDPVDRILVATAMVHRLAVVTPDRMIWKYDEITAIW